MTSTVTLPASLRAEYGKRSSQVWEASNRAGTLRDSGAAGAPSVPPALPWPPRAWALPAAPKPEPNASWPPDSPTAGSPTAVGDAACGMKLSASGAVVGVSASDLPCAAELRATAPSARELARSVPKLAAAGGRCVSCCACEGPTSAGAALSGATSSTGASGTSRSYITTMDCSVGTCAGACPAIGTTAARPRCPPRASVVVHTQRWADRRRTSGFVRSAGTLQGLRSFASGTFRRLFPLVYPHHAPS